MGLDIKRFIGKVDEEFVCPICQNIIEDPIGSQCEHLFCKSCINEWLQVKSICPVDRKSLNSSQLCETSRFFRNLYFKLTLKCVFEKNGCENICKIEELNNHETKCKFNPIVKSECENGCDALLTINELKSHNCIEYLKSINLENKKQLDEAQIQILMQEESITDSNQLNSTLKERLRIRDVELKRSNIIKAEQSKTIKDLRNKVSAQDFELNELKKKVKSQSESFLKILEIIRRESVSVTTNSINSGQHFSGVVVHQNVSCGGCKVDPIRGVRFKCSVCDNYDLCEFCEFKSDIHLKSHPMIKYNIPEEKSKAKINFKIENFSKLRSVVSSPPAFIRKLPWRLNAWPHNEDGKKVQDGQSIEYLGLFLQCDGDSNSNIWYCKANVEFRMISQKEGIENYTSKLEHIYKSSEVSDWGYSKFKRWDYILNAENGYIKDDAIILEVCFSADATEAVSS